MTEGGAADLAEVSRRTRALDVALLAEVPEHERAGIVALLNGLSEHWETVADHLRNNPTKYYPSTQEFAVRRWG